MHVALKKENIKKLRKIPYRSGKLINTYLKKFSYIYAGHTDG
jgi:hypothetical protein